MAKKEIKQFRVVMECVVIKSVYVTDCTEQEAKEKPWEYAVEEVEDEQVSYKVIDVKPISS